MTPRALAFCALAVVSACDPFGTVRCLDDASCPPSEPACVEGRCAVGHAGEGEGEGEGEGQGQRVACTADDACGAGLCCDASACASDAGTCTGAPVGACATERSSRDREPSAPALFAVIPTATSPCTPDGAGVQVSLAYEDRDGDMTTSAASGPALYVQTATSVLAFTFQAGQILSESGDGFAGTLDVVGCVDAFDGPVAVWTQDTVGHLSNVVCAP